MGTPEFAVAPLKKLIDHNYHIAAVVTVPDKPAGRGLKMQASPVKQFAAEHEIPVLQPVKLNDLEFLAALKQLNASLYIVVAFRKLPEAVWSLPPLGCFNLHASLLPQYRGAAPINHAVINGERTTGATTFFIDDQIDTGKIILQREMPIGDDETAGEVHDRLMVLGAELVVETTEAILSNNFTATEQQFVTPSGNNSGANSSVGNELNKAPKIFRENCRINWHQKSSVIHNFIRGLSPYPGAYGILNTSDGDKEFKALKSTLTNTPSKESPGMVKIAGDHLYVSTLDNEIELIIIQPSGKKAMTTAEFIRGNKSLLIGFTG